MKFVARHPRPTPAFLPCFEFKPFTQITDSGENREIIRKEKPPRYIPRGSLVGPWREVTGSMAIALEAALLEQLRRREEDAFTLIYERHKAQIYNYLYRLSGDRELADDLTHDTFLSAYESLPKLRPDSNIAPWLYRIATNRFRDLLRRKRVISWLPWNDGPQIENILSVQGGEDNLSEREVVQAALDTMKPEYSMCLVLRLAEGFSSEEAGQILGISPEAVRMRLSRARQMFKVAYQNLDKGGERDVV